jgi:uncharacterized protein (TIGR03067 family)
MNSFSLFLFSQNEKETPKNPVNPNASKILDQVSEAVKTYDAKKQKFQEDVLGMFDKKETISRSKGDIKILNQLKNEKDNFLKEGKDPTLFFITDQKRSLELAKLSLIKSYEKHIKECLTLKFDFEADELVKELETLKNEKAENKFKPNIKTNAPPINKNNNEMLQGDWICIMEEVKGQPYTKDKVKEMNKRMNVNKNSMIIKRVIGGKLGSYEGKFTLDPTMTPKKFDFTGKGPSGANVEWKGIYELTENEFKVIYVYNEGIRPKEFKTLKGETGLCVYVQYKRDKD